MENLSTFTTDSELCFQDNPSANELNHPSNTGDTGQGTMLGLSRWAGEDSSYRTIRRFYYKAIPWAEVFW